MKLDSKQARRLMVALASHTGWSRESILDMPIMEVVADLEALQSE